MVWPTSQVQQTTGFLSGPIFSFEAQEHLCLHSMCFVSWWILPPPAAPWRWAVSTCSTSMALIEGKERESCCFYVYIYATGLVKVAAVSTSVKEGAGGEGQAQEFSSWGEKTTLMQEVWGGFYRGRLCQLSQYQGRFHTYCGNLHRYVCVGGWSNKIKCLFKKNPNFSWVGFVCRYRNLPQMMT